MAILKKVEPAGNHQCQTPKNPEMDYGAGTVWECDKCWRQAILDHDQREGWIWVWLPKAKYLKDSE